MQRNPIGLIGVALIFAASGCAAAQPTVNLEDGIRAAEYLARGDIHSRAKRFQEALESYQEASKIYPNDPRVLYAIASANRDLGNYREALKHFSRVLEVAPGDPRNSRVHGQIGWIHWRAGNYATAKDAYQSALKLNPKDWRTLWYLADLHYKTKDYDSCRDYARRFKQLVADQDPDLIGEEERIAMRRSAVQMEEYLRRIEQGTVSR